MTVFSQNGYVANDRDLTDSFTVPGTKVSLRLARGATATVLLWLASRFDDQVEDIDVAGSFPEDSAPDIPSGGPSAELDDWSYDERLVTDSDTEVSNHASGTAIDLNATQHPRGVKNSYTSEQEAQVRRLLAQLVDPVTGTCVVRWGEDYVSAPTDGMHFEINAEPKAVARVAATLSLEIEDNDMQLTDTVSLTPPDRQTLGLAPGQDASVALLLRRSALAEGKVDELADEIAAIKAANAAQTAKLDQLLAKLH